MKLFTYRGRRIRPWMLGIRKFLYFSLLLPFLVLMGYIIYLNQDYYWQGNYYWFGGTLFAVLTWFPAIYILQLYLEERFLFFKKIQRLWVMARYLMEHGYYYEKVTTVGNKQKKKLRFPKIYLKQNQYDLYVCFEMQGNKFQDKFKKIGGDLEDTFFMDFMEQTYEEKFVVYRLAYSALLNRINASDVEYVEGKGIRLMKNFFWDFINDPHLLIAGGTGGGKTVFLRSLLVALLKIGTVTVYDPKRADFLSLADLPVLKGRVFFMPEDIVDSIERELQVMWARYDYMRSEAKRLGHRELKSWAEYGLEPHFILGDEWNSLMASLTPRLRERADRAMTQIILQGRQSGVYAIKAMQKPSYDDLPTKIRSNMMLHISLGRLDRGGYDMMFGDENKNKEFRYVKFVAGLRAYGRGFAAVFGDVAREFYSPFMPKGFSFYDLFESYPRIDNRFDVVEHPELIKVFSRAETAEKLNEHFGKGVVTEHQVRKLYETMVAENYEFRVIDDKNVIGLDEIAFMQEAIETKQNSPLDYEEIVPYMMDT